MSLLQNSNAISEGGYNIANSLRFQSASSQYLSRTLGTPTAGTKYTFSGWVKRGSLSISADLITGGANTGTTNYGQFYFNTADQLNFLDIVGGTTVCSIVTSAVFRDPSAWYHVVLAVDTTQATASNRLLIYINGVQQALTITTSYGLNVVGNINTNANIGGLGAIRYNSSFTNYLDGYMAEVNFVDGQALTPSSFGETNTLTGQWVAKKYTGTYGTNGFYLKFSNGTSTTTLGADSSGNGNNWTLTNFTRSAGVSDCWMYDVPSGNGSSASGTQPNSNYCVLNPLDKNSSISITAANLNASSTGGAGWTSGRSSLYVSSGKWYWEFYHTYTSPNGMIAGIADTNFNPLTQRAGDTSGSYVIASDGNKGNNGSFTSYYTPSLPSGTWIGVALDLDAGTLVFYRNNTSLGTAFTGISGSFAPVLSIYGGQGIASYFNFGNRSFNYTPPTGFKALCTANLPASTIVKGNQYMDAVTWTGADTSTSRTFSNLNFQPDLVWTKARSQAYNNLLFDAVRGAGSNKDLSSNLTGAEGSSLTASYGYLSSFNSNGTTWTRGSLGAGTNPDGYADYDELNATYVSWNWNAGGSTVTNTNGTISSQVRANPTAGVSVVTFTSTGSAGAVTVGHGLGVAPAMVITKERGAVGAWGVYHKGLPTPASQYLNLQTTGAVSTNTSYWGNTNPTSTVVTLGNGTMMALNTTMVMYCFAEIAGFSKFGSYTGNGSADGPFVYCGFRPKFVMIKRTDAAGYSWYIYDSVRDTYNAESLHLSPNTSTAEGTFAGFDFLSNGFKNRSTDGAFNANGGTYIYMAFAESPFQNSNSR